MEWLNEELQKRNWTRAELARRGGFNSSSLYLLDSGRRRPGPEICEGIARALNLPVEAVFRHAGLLPPVPESSPVSEELAYINRQLPPSKQLELLDLARVILERYERTKKSRGKDEPD